MRMLEKLMEAINEVEDEHKVDNINDMYPAHYFDYFYGTSTGGLEIVMRCKRRDFY